MGFCDLPLADKVCGVGEVVDFASNPGQAIGGWLAKSAGELAATAADLAATAVDSTTHVDLGAGWFRDNYALLLPIALVTLVATFCAQLIRAAIRRDGQALTQALTGTAVGVLFAFTAISVTTIALEVVDALSAGLLKASGLSIESAVRRIVKVGELGALTTLGWLVMVLAALGSALGAVLFWCVMMVRKVGILVMVTLAPFAGAGGGWEIARRWRKGWTIATATLVVSKLLMTIIFVLGVAAMGKSEAKDGVAALADVLAGIVIMVLVLLCPYATFKFVHWAAEDTDGESLHRAGGAGAHLTQQYAQRTGRKAASMAATAGAGGGAAAGAAPSGPSANPGGGFPGDIAANPTGDGPSPTPVSHNGEPSNEDSESPDLSKGVQPPPTSPDEDTSGQLGGGPDPTGTGQSGPWQSTPPATSPPAGDDSSSATVQPPHSSGPPPSPTDT